MITDGQYDQAKKFQATLNEHFPRLKWAVACYGLSTCDWLENDTEWLVRAVLDLKNEGLVGLCPIKIEIAMLDNGAYIVAEMMTGHMVGKILLDPLDVHKMKLVCT